MAKSELIYPCGEPPGHGQIKVLAPGVLWMRMPLAPPLSHINLWAIEDAEGWTLVDTGLGNPATVDLWRGLFDTGLGGRPLRRLLVTHMHADHAGLAGWLTQHADCELWMTRLEYLQGRVLESVGPDVHPVYQDFYRAAGWDAAALQRLQARFDTRAPFSALPGRYRRISDGETIRIGDHDWQVVVGSGHSPEHACLYCADLDLLISGDQVLPRISSHVGVQPLEPDADPVSDWLDSIQDLKRRLPDSVLVLPSHQEPFRGLHARLDALYAEQQALLQRLQQALQQPMRVVDLFPTLFARKIEAHILWLASNETLACLNRLIRQGLCIRTRDAEGVFWYRASLDVPSHSDDLSPAVERLRPHMI